MKVLSLEVAEDSWLSRPLLNEHGVRRGRNLGR